MKYFVNAAIGVVAPFSSSHVSAKNKSHQKVEELKLINLCKTARAELLSRTAVNFSVDAFKMGGNWQEKTPISLDLNADRKSDKVSIAEYSVKTQFTRDPKDALNEEDPTNMFNNRFLVLLCSSR